MLALKECLIREGVLNLTGVNAGGTSSDTSNNNSNAVNFSFTTTPITTTTSTTNNNNNTYGTPANAVRSATLRNQKSVASTQNLDIENNSASSSNLSSASATANTSCQQLSSQEQQPQSVQQQEQPLQQPKPKQHTKSTRYQGQHPHFHHHTAPVYYTDVHLRIHTPPTAAGDAAALNDRYQSVYNTASQLVKERYFPRTSTATVVPPPIGPGTGVLATPPKTAIPAPPATATGATAANSTYNNSAGAPAVAAGHSAFFRGGSAGSERKSLEGCAKLSPTLASATKGDFSSYTPFDGSGSCSSNSRVNVQSLDDRQLNAVVTASDSASSRSRHPQRFAGRKRAVRVRSESRPISALYDIICKEKGLDIGTSSTNDEDSSATNSHGDDNTNDNAPLYTAPIPNSNCNNDSIAGFERNFDYAKRANSTDPTTASAPVSVSPPEPHSGSIMNCGRDIGISVVKGETIVAPISTLAAPKAVTERLKRTKPREKQKKRKGHSKSSSLFIHSLTDENDDDWNSSDVSLSPDVDGGSNSNNSQNARRKFKLKSSRKTTNLVDLVTKAGKACQEAEAAALPKQSPTPPPSPPAAKPTAERSNVETQQPSPRPRPNPIPNPQPPQQSETHSNPNAHHCGKCPIHMHPPVPYHQIPPHTSSVAHCSESPISSRAFSLPASGCAKQPHCHLLFGDGCYSTPAKLYVAPVTMHLRKAISSVPVGSSKCSVVEKVSSSDPLVASKSATERELRAAVREQKRRNTDGAASMIPVPTSPLHYKQHLLQQRQQHHSDDEVAGEHKHATNARRFINRPSRTPSRGRDSSVNGDASVQLEYPQQQCGSDSSTSPTSAPAASSPLPAANGNHLITQHDNNNERNNASNQQQPDCAAATVMTNSAAAAVAAGSSDSGATRTATTGVHAVLSAGTNNAPALQQRKCDETTHSLKHTGSKSCSPIPSNYHHSHSHSHNHSNNNNNINSYAMPTETSVLKQKTPNANANAMQCSRKKPLSPLLITTTTTTTQPASFKPGTKDSAFSPILGAPASPEKPTNCVQFVRTTKTSRLRAAALDKKKDEELQQQQQQVRNYSSASPISPRHQLPLHSPKPLDTPSAASPTEAHRSPATPEPNTKASETKGKASTLPVRRLRTTSSLDLSDDAKKLVPTVSVSLKQNLSDMQFNGGGVNANKKTPSPKSKKLRRPSVECTVKLKSVGGKLSTAEESEVPLTAVVETDDFAEPTARPRSSTMYGEEERKNLKRAAAKRKEKKPQSPVRNSKTPEQRDKSAKRKSNLNRSLNEEATQDGDEAAATRRRRRRQLGMARQLIPADNEIMRKLIGQKPRAPITPCPSQTNIDLTASKNELACHLEAACRSWDMVEPGVIDGRRAKTVSPKFDEVQLKPETKTTKATRVSRRSDTLHLGDLRTLRSNDVNRKMNERTMSDLAEILKIAEKAGHTTEKTVAQESGTVNTAALDAPAPKLEKKFTADSKKSVESIVVNDLPEKSGEAAVAATERGQSPAKHATFLKDPQPDEHQPELIAEHKSAKADGLRQRVLKARSMERDGGHNPPKLSPILRRKSTDDPPICPAATPAISSAHNHIVSILKKKDHIVGESSASSSNASPVTFSANVVDTPSNKHKRVGILKKRSSLDESRYYSRSHSPDERSILIKSARRNSLEETAGTSQQLQQHGILKQSSYDSSKSDGCPSATEPHPHGILKKKDSTSTPSDGGSHAPKHVSISQAVILAAAELCRETADVTHVALDHDESGYTPSNEEYEIRPILKLESTSSDDAMRQPKPILKKKSSGDADEHEIRPILKTSRKSSREEFDLSGVSGDESRYHSESSPQTQMRPILKTDSPSKRRSLGGEEHDCGEERCGDGSSTNLATSPSLLQRRTHSLERSEPPLVDLAAALDAITTSQATVAERIKSMEKFLNNNVGTPNPSSWGSPRQTGATPNIVRPSAIKRDLFRDRYKTQPVTSNEKNFFKLPSTSFDSSAPSAFKPTKSLEALNYISFAQLPTAAAASTLARGSASLNDSENQSNSTGELTPSLGSDSERIFQMSGIDDSVNTSAAHGTPTTSAMGDAADEGHVSELLRKNSVRARANMFQQLQEQTRRADRTSLTSPRRAFRQTSPTPVTPATSSVNSDEPKTPQNPLAEEIEPSSLPVSERLRFFSSLSGGAANRSAASSYTHSPPHRHSSIERYSNASGYSSAYPYIYLAPTVQRSSGGSAASTGTSSTSVTPTPLECCYAVGGCESAISSPDGTHSASHVDGIEIHQSPPPATHQTSACIKLTKSASYSMEPPPPHAVDHTADVSASAAVTGGARRLKLKTIGKLMLPQTFLSNSRNSDNNNSDASDNVNGEEADSRLPPAKKIGQLQSLFIENCQQVSPNHQPLNSKCDKYELKLAPYNALTSLENNDNESDASVALAQRKLHNGGLPSLQQQGSDDSNTDSGKENNCGNSNSNANGALAATTPGTPSSSEHAALPIAEMRKKLTRIMSNTASVPQPVLSTRQSTTPRSAKIADKYAKYFGIASNGLSNSYGNGNSSTKAKGANPEVARAPADKGAKCNGSQLWNSNQPNTPPSAKIADKYAKYFNSTSNGLSNSNNNNSPKAKESEQQKKAPSSSAVAVAAAAATNHYVVKRCLHNMPDVCQVTPKLHCALLGDKLMELSEAHTPPLAAINPNVRLQSSTPFYTPPALLTPTEAQTPLCSAGNSATSINGNAAQKRRDLPQRCHSSIATHTPSSSQTSLVNANAPSTSRAVVIGCTLRTRLLAIRRSMHHCETVQCYEDISVSDENLPNACAAFDGIAVSERELLNAAAEFDRIFQGIV